VQALDTIKKAGSSFPKDNAKKLEKEVSNGSSSIVRVKQSSYLLLFFSFLQVDELTKKFVKSAEEICKAKEKEIISG